MRPRLLSRVLVSLLLGASVLVVRAPAVAAQGDNAAVAVNTKDGSSVFRLAFSVRRVAGPVVDQTNAAVAYASCTVCQTVAIAIQVVLVMGDPEVVTPENVAIAINEQCDLCDTLASAYQFVLGTGQPVRFTAEGRRRINDVRQALRELRKSDLPIREIQARVDHLADELRGVLRTELVTVASGSEHRPSPSPTPSPTPSATPASGTSTSFTTTSTSTTTTTSTTAPASSSTSSTSSASTSPTTTTTTSP